MLDQKLIRENPTFIKDRLSLRGNDFNISETHRLTIDKKEIDIEISNLQSESKQLSKNIGQTIRNNDDSEGLITLKERGNKLRVKISELEDKKRSIDKQLQEKILSLPNLPSKDVPFGKNENENVQLKKWGDPIKKNNLKTHWEIGETLKLFDSKRSTSISKSRILFSANGILSDAPGASNFL